MNYTRSEAKTGI